MQLNLRDLPEPASEVRSPSLDTVVALMNDHRFSEAAGHCATLIERDPSDHTPYICLAQLAEIAGDLEQCANYLSEAIIRQPGGREAYVRLSSVMHKLGNGEFAVRALEVAIELDRTDMATALKLADLLFEQGNRERAASVYAEVLAADPSCGRSRAMLKLLGKAPGGSASAAVLRMPELRHRQLLDSNPAWRRVHLAAISPDGYTHTAAFDDLMLGFAHAFRELGSACSIAVNELRADAVNIVFGGHMIGDAAIAEQLPPHTILYNLEQAAGFGVERYPVYATLLRHLPVWDYSPRNIDLLKTATGNDRIHHVRIGHASAMERIAASGAQTTDVLFYGSLNERRSAVLRELEAAGVKVRHLFNVYGSERDAAIRDAKIVLNMHFYEDSIHEVVRTSFLLANGKAVVSECNPATEIETDLRDAMRAVPYDGLVPACLDLLFDDGARRALEMHGKAVFGLRDQRELLTAAISETQLTR